MTAAFWYKPAMSKLEAVLERLAKLPPDRQETMAAELDFLMDMEENPFPVLSPAQNAVLAERLAAGQAELLTHADVVAHFETKFGR